MPSGMESIGILNVLTLSLGSICNFGALSLLIYLWAYSPNFTQNPDAPYVWKLVVLHGWLSRSITLSTLVIRFFIGSISAICAAMIAAVALEETGVPLAYVPSFLVLRCLPSNPHNLAGGLLLRRSWSAQRLAFWAYLSIAVGLLSQFASTILLSDLDYGFVQGFSVLSPRAFDFANASNVIDSTSVFSNNPWTSPLTTYPLFAEYRRGTTTLGAVEDTGYTVRAFPPISDSPTRSNLRGYDGYMLAIDSRVTCLAPGMETFRAGAQKDDRYYDWYSDGYLQIYGAWVLDFSVIPPSSPIMFNDGYGLGYDSDTFNCSIATASNSTLDRANREWKVTMCQTLTSSMGMTSAFDPLCNGDHLDSIFCEDSTPFLMFNTSGRWVEWYSKLWQQDASKWDTSTNGAWTRMSLQDSDLTVDVSLCFINPSPHVIPINATDGYGVPEPVLGWNQTTDDFAAADAVRMYAGYAEGAPPGSRGTLSLAPRSNWSVDSIPLQLDLDNIYSLYDILAATDDDDFIALLCTFCASFTCTTNCHGHNALHLSRTHVAVFQAVLASTGSIAIALQTYFTVITQARYYNYLPEFDHFDSQATSTFLVSTLIPHRIDGLMLICAIELIHFWVTIVVLILFLRRRRRVFLGNCWQAFAQVRGTPVNDVLDALGARSSDKGVKGYLKDKKMDSMAVRIESDRAG
ncbi:hypothetical protein CONLIGDRAFT_40899 [Coniochaeta ligniaria NRRL 30616]|uniref:Ig-like domain-containing protein n=1 Tax=Coniochaeta ligniaria NRRL 30616 TaxID=1408157 RepID=A0A1J7J5L1_9PEZI|nr:hypothetical protein CONLIGDRAFT_40899 [Coniochaeta ligniaria NRRL 30616]